MNDATSKRRCLFHAGLVLATLVVARGFEDDAPGGAHLEIQPHVFEPSAKASVMRRETRATEGDDMAKSLSMHPVERKRIKGTLHVSVDHGGKFLSQPRVVDSMAEGIADAANVNRQAVRILEFTKPSMLMEQATLTAGGEVEREQDNLEFAFEMKLPGSQADDAQSHLTSMRHATVASKIGDALKYHGAHGMNLAITSFAVHEMRTIQDGTHRQPTTPEGSSGKMFGMIGEIELKLDPGMHGFAGNHDSQNAVCEGVAFAANVSLDDCKVTRYMQSTDNDARFQFNLTIPDESYAKIKYTLESADQTEVGEKIQGALGTTFHSSLTVSKLKASKQPRSTVYVGVQGELLLKVPGDAENLMVVMANQAVHMAIKKSVAETCEVSSTDIHMGFTEGTAPDSSDGQFMNCSFWLHSDKAWKVKELVDATSKTALKDKINSEAAITTPISVEEFYVEKITAAQAAAMPPIASPWSTANATDTVAEIGGWLNFTTNEANTFFDDGKAQMAIAEALAHAGHIAVEEFRIALHRVPEPEMPGDDAHALLLRNISADAIMETVAVQWSADLMKMFLKTVQHKIETASPTALADDIEERMVTMAFDRPTITIDQLTCHTEPVRIPGEPQPPDNDFGNATGHF